MFCEHRRPAILRKQTSSTKRLRLSSPICFSSEEYVEDNKSVAPGHDQNLHYTVDENRLDPTKASFDLLPDLPLISILEKVPLVDLLPLRVLSRRINDIANTSVIKQRSTLHLMSYYDPNLNSNYLRVRFDLSRFFDIDLLSFDFFIGIDDNVYIKWISEQKNGEPWTKPPQPWGRFLMIQRPEAADKLATTFPAIKSLVIFDCMLNEVEIVKLLTRWRHTLTSFKLVTFEQNFYWPMIFSILNDMPQLQHLSLFSPYGFQFRPQLPFLRQLKTFQLAFYDHVGGERQSWLNHFLAQLNPNVLQQVDVGIFVLETHRNAFFCYNLKQLYKKQPAIAAKLRRLHFPSNTKKFCHFLALKFPSISWLDVRLTSVNDLKQMSRLSGLRVLALRSNKDFYSDCALNEANWQTLAKISPFVSVTKLILFDFTIKEKLMKKLFPNVITVEQICHKEDIEEE